jgi:DNA-binding transcriptional ArsR family regulator
MQVQLTDKGRVTLETLENAQREFYVTSMLPRSREFELVLEPQKGWTMTNETLLFLGRGTNFNSPINPIPSIASELQINTIPSIASELQSIYELPSMVFEEVLWELVQHDLIVLSNTTAYSEEVITWLSDTAKLFAHPSRWVILSELERHNSCTSRDLCAALGGAGVMTMRQHLLPLIAAQFVEQRRPGRWIEYNLVPLMLYTYHRRLTRHLNLI